MNKSNFKPNKIQVRNKVLDILDIFLRERPGKLSSDLF